MRLEKEKSIRVICTERLPNGKTDSCSFVVYGTTKGRLMKFLREAIWQKTRKKRVLRSNKR